MFFSLFIITAKSKTSKMSGNYYSSTIFLQTCSIIILKIVTKCRRLLYVLFNNDEIMKMFIIVQIDLQFL